MLTKMRFACLLSLAIPALGTVKTGTLHIMNVNIAPDGFTRAASLISSVHPGPVITALKGDRIQMSVHNELTDPAQYLGTSIHWHGMFQRSTNFMDGVPGVTQCPIVPGAAFLYDFVVDQAGTYWYHSHFGVQYCDGVRGALIVYDPSDPLQLLYDVDTRSTIITLSEWYHVTAQSLSGTIPAADSTLINGQGRYCGGPKVPFAVVNVSRGKRYRLRLISISCDPNFTFSIDGHDLTIIEVEGTAVVPYTINTIQILAGQRYSAVLNANQTVGNYWIRALPNSGQGNLSSTFEGGVNSAILRYTGAPIADPNSTQQKDQKLLVEADLHPNLDPLAPGNPTPDGADVTFNLTLGFSEELFKFSINGNIFVPPPVLVLLQIMSGARNAHDLLPPGGVLTVERNKTVQINFPSGLIGGPHPFHLHGHTFSVVKSADTGSFNFENPVRRDVVNVGEREGDFVAIRFRTDNPGPWIIHCHIDFHLDEGLAIVLAEAPDDTVSANPNVPTAWRGLCPAWDQFSNSTSV